MLDALFPYLHNELFLKVAAFIGKLSPFWVAAVLGVAFWRAWMMYVRAEFIQKQGSVLLEIKLPKETFKSPLAMEVFFTSLFQTGSATVIETYWGGKVRPWFSFEMVSLDGQIRFFVWTWPKFKNLIESQLYAQYPSVEIYEVPDYTSAVYHDPENLPLWGTYFKLTKPDAYPIKTYVDYKLDKEQEQEYMIDPMTSVLEYMGSMRKGEQIWFQIIIQAHKKEGLSEGRLFKRADWTKAAMDEIKKIREEAIQDVEGVKLPNMTQGQKEAIEGIQRSISKFPFEVSIRGFYIATKEAFDSSRFSGLIGSFRQYSSNTLNGFKLGTFTDFDYPWQDFRRIRRNAIERKMLDAYKRRSFFQYPYKNFKQKPFILTTEELATIFHLPGQVASTPTFDRISSKKVEAPPNLPI